MSQKFVATIFFEQIRIERPLYGGDFVLPAVPKGDPPALVLVRDHTQIVQMPFSAGGHKIPHLIAAEHICNDILLHAATLGLGMSVECGPGVWIVRDTVPERHPDGSPIMLADGRYQTRAANDEERQQMYQEDMAFSVLRQKRYGDYLISQAEVYAKNPKERVYITPRMRAAARYYNQEVEWLEDASSDLKLCPFCVKSIAITAIKCSHCGEIVDAPRHAALLANRKRLEKEALAIT